MNTADVMTSIVVALIAIVCGLVAYIFTRNQKITDARLSHSDRLLEQMVESNQKLGDLIKDHDYQLRMIRDKLKIKLQ